MRGCCLHQGADEHQVKKRSFAFTLVYIKCFRTYSVYLSLRLPAQILYAGIHLPPQRKARALPRRAQNYPRCSNHAQAVLCAQSIRKTRCKRYPLSRIQPLSHGALSFIAVTAPLTQGSRGSRSVRLAASRGSRSVRLAASRGSRSVYHSAKRRGEKCVPPYLPLYPSMALSSEKASPEFSLNLRSKSSTVRFFFSSPETSKIILPSFIIIRRLPCLRASLIL